MSATLRAQSHNTYLVEVSPQRILYKARENYKDYQLFSLPLPWTYVVIRTDNFMPTHLLCATRAITESSRRVCPMPLIGLTSTGGMCPGTINYWHKGTFEEKLLAAVTGALASSGTAGSGYVSHLHSNPAFQQLAQAIGDKAFFNLGREITDFGTQLSRAQEIVRKVYLYWESLAEFPSDITLSQQSISDWGFTSFMSQPQTLVE